MSDLDWAPILLRSIKTDGVEQLVPVGMSCDPTLPRFSFDAELYKDGVYVEIECIGLMQPRFGVVELPPNHEEVVNPVTIEAEFVCKDQKRTRKVTVTGVKPVGHGVSTKCVPFRYKQTFTGKGTIKYSEFKTE